MTKQEEILEGIARLIANSYKELQKLNALDPVSHNIDKAIRTVLFEESNKFMSYFYNVGLINNLPES